MHAKTNISAQDSLERQTLMTDANKPVLVRWGSELNQNSDNVTTNITNTDCPSVNSQQHDFISVLRETCQDYPGRDLILIRDDIELPQQLLQRMAFWLEQLPDSDALTVLSNCTPTYNPFGSATDIPEPPADADIDVMVANTSQKHLYAAMQWPQHLVWLKADTALLVSQIDRDLNDAIPERLGVRMLVADDIFARSHRHPLVIPAPLYDWDLPPAFAAEYRQQHLHKLLRDQAWSLQRIDPTSQPVMLHITHSWGGGVSRWVEDYCAYDNQHTHLVLQTRGFWKKKQYGTHLSLHQNHPDGPKLGEWWLIPGIFSTEIRHSQYQEVLDIIQQCYAISRVLVSSLIGHSLDALRCPIPTVQVIHDYYPAWPLLSIPPGDDPEQIDLPKSLAAANADELEFVDRNSDDWAVLTRSWLHYLRNPRVQVVAPTHSAHQQLLAICPDAKQVPISVIAHGLRDWNEPSSSNQQNQQDTQHSTTKSEPIKVLFLGRLQKGKGKDLLLQALPHLNEQIHITALGCGKEGTALLGRPNINVIMQYDWQTLPAQIRRIQPDIALLLSTVAETFSYTLSELQALNVPAIATRHGSFVERIQHGINGLLITADSEALVSTLNGLLDNRIIISQLRQQLSLLKPNSMQQMLHDYETIWNSIETPARPIQAVLLKNNVNNAQLIYQQRLSEWRGKALQSITGKLQGVYHEMGKRLKRIRRQTHELQQTHQEKDQLHEALNTITQHMRQATGQLQQQQQHLQNTHSQLQHRQEQLDMILSSRSWQLTKPLRLLNRVLHNLKLHETYKPTRWPRLFNKLIQRIHRHGFKTTLYNLQALPEHTSIGHFFDTQPSDAPVDWPLFDQTIDQPITHIVLLGQHQLLSLSTLLNQLLSTFESQPAQLHILFDSPATDINNYLKESNNLQLYTSRKQLYNSLRSAYVAGQIKQILLIQGSIISHPDSLSALLKSTQSQPQAMLIGGTPTQPKAALANPLDNYSRVAKQLHPALLLLRGSGVDGLLQSKFPQHVLSQVLPDIAELIQSCDGLIWQQHNARYHCLDEGCEPVLMPTVESIHKPAILVIDTWVPTPDKDSGSLRMVNLLQLLIDIGWQVVFCPFNKRHEGRYTEDLQSIGVEVWYQPYLNQFSQFLSQQGTRFQSVILSRHQTAGDLLKAVRLHCPQAQVIFDTVDLHYLREQREAELENSLQLKRIAEQTKRQELSIIDKTDLTLVVSTVEQALLAEVAPDSRVEILSNIHHAHGRRNDFHQRQDMLFVGGFQHPPNIDAVRWLCGDIWPLIADHLPEAKLHIIGSKMPAEITAFASKRVITHGYVENLDAFHDNCRLSLAPLRYGAGVKGKINSAMSYGLPVVATSAAAEGMGLQHEQHVLLGDSADSFAAAVLRLYSDEQLWHQLSDAGLENINEHFSLAVAEAQLRKILPDIYQP